MASSVDAYGLGLSLDLPTSGSDGRAPRPTQSEAAMLVDLVRQVAYDTVAPGVIDRDRDEVFDRRIVRELGDLGLLGGVVPVKYGGAGLDHVTFAAAIEEMSKVDHLYGLAMSFPSGLAGAGIISHGSDRLKARLLPDLCAGRTMASTGLTEPSSGTHVSNMRTRCSRQSDYYVLDGQKTWISFIDVSDWILTFATLDPARRDAVCAFVVPSDSPGVRLQPFSNKLGFRAIATGDVFFDSVRVPVENRVGDEGQGLEVAMAAVEQGRLGVAARSIGIAQDCLNRSVAYARDREVFGQAIGRFQLVQSMITDMVIGIESARAFTIQLALKRDQGLRARREASLAKMHASDIALTAASNAVQIHGAYGTHEDYHVGRHFRDAKVMQIIEGQNDLHRGMIAEYALGYRSDGDGRR
jgi:alkylation response protein AidB-like acyl-CoA dehydrogenase